MRGYTSAIDEERAKNSRTHRTNSKTDIAWGHQIRFVCIPAVPDGEDHRTGVETSSIQKVMDGDLV